MSTNSVPFVLDEMHLLARIQEGLAPSSAQLQEVGRLLFCALMPPPILSAFEQVRAALPANTRLRLCLDVHLPELAHLPWESLFNPDDDTFLAQCGEVVRFLDSRFNPPPPIRGALKILYVLQRIAPAQTVGAIPRGCPSVDVEQLFGVGGCAEITVLREATAAQVRSLLRRQSFHILHYDGDVLFGARSHFLALPDEEGTIQPLSGAALSTFLDGTSVRVVVLAGCERFVGVGQQLMRAGELSAVVAMQFAISKKSVLAFNRGFYGALVEGYPIDAAVAKGRLALDTHQADWATPLLWLRRTPRILANVYLEASQEHIPLEAISIRHSEMRAIHLKRDKVVRTSVVQVRRKRMKSLLQAMPHFLVWGFVALLLGLVLIWQGSMMRQHSASFETPAATELRLAQSEAEAAEAKAKAGEALFELSHDNHERALLLALASASIDRRPYPLLVSRALSNSLHQTLSDSELTGHEGEVHLVAWRPDGRQILTAAKDSTVRLWDLNGQESHKLRAHQGWVTSVAWSPDGKQLLTGSYDNSARLWDVPNGNQRYILNGSERWVLSVAFRPDGKQVLTGSYDGTVRLWDAASGHELQSLKGHEGPVNAVAWSPDGRQIVSVSDDKTARLWDLKGNLLHILRGHKEALHSVAWSPTGKQLLTAARSARLWDAASGQELHRLEGQAGQVNAIAWRPDGTQVLTGGEDNSARVWDVTSGRELQLLRGHEGPINALAWHPNGTSIVTGSDDGTVRLFLEDGSTLNILEGHTGLIHSLAWHPDGKQLLTSSADQSARLWITDQALLLAKVTQQVCQLVGNDDLIRAEIPSWKGCQAEQAALADDLAAIKGWQSDAEPLTKEPLPPSVAPSDPPPPLPTTSAGQRPEIHGAGFVLSIAVNSSEQPFQQPTSLTWGPGEAMYVSTMGGAIIKVAADGTRTTFAEEFDHPLGLAFRPGTNLLYVADRGGISTVRDRDADGYAESVTPLITGLPCCYANLHQTNGIQFGPDGWLYIAEGSVSDHGETLAEPWHAAILRVQPDEGQKSLEYVAKGVRNAYDLVVRPNGEMFAADNGADYGPPEELNHIIAGEHYGWPECITEAPGKVAIDLKWPNFSDCEKRRAAIGTFIPHASPITSYEAEQFPTSYRGNLFVALWNRSPDAYRIVRVQLTPNGDTFIATITPFITNLRLPLDVAIGPDGALYVADWDVGHIYKAEYRP
jgi:WD40 repeat protein/glucose/arabinose dehydrogenase